MQPLVGGLLTGSGEVQVLRGIANVDHRAIILSEVRRQAVPDPAVENADAARLTDGVHGLRVGLQLLLLRPGGVGVLGAGP